MISQSWLIRRGQADILNSGVEHAEAQRLLRARYAQLNEMAIERHCVIHFYEQNSNSAELVDVGCRVKRTRRRRS